MTGLDEFKEMFGSITVLNVVEFALAILFCYLIYQKVSKYLIGRYEASKKKDEQLKTALDAVSKYPEYRAQSIRIQKELQTEIEALRSAQNEQTSRLKKMEDDTTRRERNRLRDRLLQSYRYYTDPSCNPTAHGIRWRPRRFGRCSATTRMSVGMGTFTPSFSRR